MGNEGTYTRETKKGNTVEDELPKHRVTFANDFYVGKYEVTQAQWSSVMGVNPSKFLQCGTNCPVEQVSRGDVKEFIEKLNTKTGKGYRLLSEAEWEYATKAGTTTDTYAGDLDIKGRSNAPILDAISYYGGNSGVNYSGSTDCSGWLERQHASNLCGTHPVGSKQANAFGLYDMIGNVWEYTQDCYHDNYNGAPVDGSAWVTDSCSDSDRVVRGGSWSRVPWVMRSSFRETISDSDSESYYIGFRLAISSSEL
jgi:formylglycine-generating enzyme required for sulfatase activity